jgi:hypothetical protein
MEVNVSRLAGVVVAYDRVLGEQMPGVDVPGRELRVRRPVWEEGTMENLSEMKPTKSIQESTHQHKNNRRVVKWSTTPISVPGGQSPLEPGTLTRKIAQAPKGVIRLNTVTQRGTKLARPKNDLSNVPKLT